MRGRRKQLIGFPPFSEDLAKSGASVGSGEGGNRTHKSWGTGITVSQTAGLTYAHLHRSQDYDTKERSGMSARVPEYVEGPKAWRNFRDAMKKVLGVPHSVIQQRIEEHRIQAAKNPRKRGPKPKLKPAS